MSAVSLWASFGMYGICYLKVLDYVLASWGWLGSVKFVLRWEKNKTAYISVLYEHCPVSQHPWLQLTQQQPKAQIQIHSREGKTRVNTHSPCKNEIQKTRGRDPRQRGLRLKSFRGEPQYYTWSWPRILTETLTWSNGRQTLFSWPRQGVAQKGERDDGRCVDGIKHLHFEDFYYSSIPAHRNHVFDPARVFLSTHWWSQHPACQRYFYKPLTIQKLPPQPASFYTPRRNFNFVVGDFMNPRHSESHKEKLLGFFI